MLSGMVYSLQAPFYPKEAENHHLYASQYGFVFGTFEIASFLIAPFCGRFINSIGPKFMTGAGLLMTGASTLIFGIMDKIEDGNLFFISCMACRVIEAMGQSAATTAIMTIIAHEFYDKTGLVISWTETFYGVGMMIGPAIGGFLFDLGGYLLPFLVVGCCLLINIPVSRIIIPSDEVLQKNLSDHQTDLSLLKVLKKPLIWIALATNSVGAISCTFLQPTLEHHLRPFHLSWSWVGFIFLLNGMGYAASNPLWGKLCDKGVSPVKSMLLGVIMIVVAFSLIGPLPFLAAEPNLGMIILGLIISGFGIGAEFVPSFIHMKQVR